LGEGSRANSHSEDSLGHLDDEESPPTQKGKGVKRPAPNEKLNSRKKRKLQDNERGLNSKDPLLGIFYRILKDWKNRNTDLEARYIPKLMKIFELLSEQAHSEDFIKFTPLFDDGILEALLHKESRIENLQTTINLLTYLIKDQTHFQKIVAFTESKKPLLDQICVFLSSPPRDSSREQYMELRLSIIRLFSEILSRYEVGLPTLLSSDQVLPRVVYVVKDELRYLRKEDPNREMSIQLVSEAVYLLHWLSKNSDDVNASLGSARQMFIAIAGWIALAKGIYSVFKHLSSVAKELLHCVDESDSLFQGSPTSLE